MLKKFIVVALLFFFSTRLFSSLVFMKLSFFSHARWAQRSFHLDSIQLLKLFLHHVKNAENEGAADHVIKGIASGLNSSSVSIMLCFQPPHLNQSMLGYCVDLIPHLYSRWSVVICEKLIGHASLKGFSFFLRSVLVWRIPAWSLRRMALQALRTRFLD